MKEGWSRLLPGLGVALGGALGFFAYLITADILYVAYGAALGLVLGAVVAALTDKPTVSGPSG